jgi:hypothetical protein
MTNPLLFIPDVVNSLDGIFGEIRHGGMHRFRFSSEHGHSGIQVERILRRYGIRVWGREVTVTGDIGFLVKKRQAVWAEYLLLRAGVPLTVPLIEEQNREYASRHTDSQMPTPWSVKGLPLSGLMDTFFESIARLLHL